MASLLWTCAISFNVLMSVKKRKWSWKSQEKSWEWYRHRYYFIIFVLSFPGALLSVIKQHSSSHNSSLGCDPGYEKLGLWYEVFFVEVFPIVLGFSCNLYVYFQIRKKMSQSAFPQSVRKRRKRIMYHYIIVCILCWIPTIIFYFVELMGFHVPALEIVGRTSLYLSGFLNFLVFGMQVRHSPAHCVLMFHAGVAAQDPHLQRSFLLVLHFLGLSLLLPASSSFRAGGPLKTSDVEKTVMFEEATISRNADLSKDKKNIYRYHKLSKDDKKALYADRPDLDPKGNNNTTSGRLSAAALSMNSGDSGRKVKKMRNFTTDGAHDEESSSSSKHSMSVLSDLVTEGEEGFDASVLSPLAALAAPPHTGSVDDARRSSSSGNAGAPGNAPQPLSSEHLIPRDSTELTLPSDDRNSLGLKVLHASSVVDGSAVSGDAVTTEQQARSLESGFLFHQSDYSVHRDSSEEDGRAVMAAACRLELVCPPKAVLLIRSPPEAI